MSTVADPTTPAPQQATPPKPADLSPRKDAQGGAGLLLPAMVDPPRARIAG